MQHGTPEQYRAEADRFRRIAEQHSAVGRVLLARDFRDRAEDCDERAQRQEGENQ
ncbi:hypothetical protein [Streptomyces wuyuanensis]|uniref:hypothetical protein n=1 Tax=Streptomyces wuyuanensis TaxID=1196353 RepID=UPI00343F3559